MPTDTQTHSNGLSAVERMQRARLALVLDQPFFGALALYLDMQATTQRPTMATDGRRLIYNPDFVHGLDDRTLKAVVAHEILHCAFGHCWRRGERDPKRWNEAADAVVNREIDELNAEATKKGEATPFPLPAGAVRLPQFADLSAEEIYSRLDQEGDQPQQQGQGKGQKGQGQQQPGKGQPGQGDAQGDQEGDADGPPSCGEVDDATNAEGDEPSKAEIDELTNEWMQRTIQAAQAAKARGSLPAGIARLVDQIKRPAVDWRDVLRRFVTEQSRTDYTWTRPNRRAPRPFILPSLRSVQLGRLAVAIDTSGSITPDLLAQFAAEVNSIIEETQPAGVTVLYADAQVAHVEEYQEGEAIQIDRAKGGGGTDFRPVFKWLEEQPEAPAALVYLTDLDGTMPDAEPAFPVLWGSTDPKRTAPFGETVAVRPEQWP